MSKFVLLLTLAVHGIWAAEVENADAASGLEVRNQDKVRLWADTRGKFRVRAALTYFDDSTETVFLTQQNGRRIKCELSRLCESDQQFVKERYASEFYSGANLYVQVSKRILATLLDRNINRPTQVRDEILGTQIYGHGRIAGNMELSLVPNSHQAILELMFHGSINTRTVGYNGPVIIFSKGHTRIIARKRITIDPKGIHQFSTRSHAKTDARTKGVSTQFNGVLDRMVRRIAEQKIAKSKAEANFIAARHAEDQFNPQMDDEVRGVVKSTSDQYRKALRAAPMFDNHFSKRLRIATTRDSLRIKMNSADRAQGGASVLPPRLVAAPDIAMRVHESAANHLFSSWLGGAKMRSSDLKSVVNGLLGRDASESNTINPDTVVVLDDKNPITLQVRGGVLALTIRGREFITDGRSWPPMDIAVSYKVSKTATDVTLSLVDEPTVQPPRLDNSQPMGLTVREAFASRMIKSRLDRELPKELVFAQVSLQKPWDKLGKLAITQVSAEDGWLVLGLESIASDAR